jgi:hypothetical protein
MPKWTVEEDMKLGAALDQLEDAIEAAHMSLKMVKWAQLNVARYTGGVLGTEINAKIRALPLEIQTLWELTQLPRKMRQEESHALAQFIDEHNQKIISVIATHHDAENS